MADQPGLRSRPPDLSSAREHRESRAKPCLAGDQDIGRPQVLINRREGQSESFAILGSPGRITIF
jgi:hypothetical protein